VAESHGEVVGESLVCRLVGKGRRKHDSKGQMSRVGRQLLGTPVRSQISPPRKGLALSPHWLTTCPEMMRFVPPRAVSAYAPVTSGAVRAISQFVADVKGPGHASGRRPKGAAYPPSVRPVAYSNACLHSALVRKISPQFPRWLCGLVPRYRPRSNGLRNRLRLGFLAFEPDRMPARLQNPPQRTSTLARR